MQLRRLLVTAGVAALALVPALSVADQVPDIGAAARTTTPIKHLVVIFQENVSFDHYFGTYPNALNPRGEPSFRAAEGTPTVNGFTPGLLAANPNLSNPQRLNRSQAVTCDQDHGYTDEQKASDGGAMDLFVQDTGAGLTLAQCLAAVHNPAPATGVTPNFAVMDYYDGNTVTALWNYAQRFSMSDNSYSTTYGPSTPGAINMISGQTFGAICNFPSPSGFASTVNAPRCATQTSNATTPGVAAPQGAGTVFGDDRPFFDKCDKSTQSTVEMGGRNVGDLLNAKNLTWGWFQGGFADCTVTHANVLGASTADYIMHHEPFQYYPQTANPQHLAPSSDAKIGQQDQANHQYDISKFFTAADAGRLPAVSFLKAPAFQDGHAAYSDPVDEQTFLVQTINHLEKLPTWNSTAVMVLYDDSDGWYDHTAGPVQLESQTPLDALTGSGKCGANPAAVPSGPTGPQEARCGFGMRQPFLVLSPFARSNFVDHTLTDQSSVTRFIEDNWRLGRIGNGSADALAGSLNGMFDFARPHVGRLFLDPATGEPVRGDDED
jgi:phospholipase C